MAPVACPNTTTTTFVSLVLPHRLLQAEEARKVCPHALPVPVFEGLHRDDVERLRPEGKNPAEDVDLGVK